MDGFDWDNGIMRSESWSVGSRGMEWGHVIGKGVPRGSRLLDGHEPLWVDVIIISEKKTRLDYWIWSKHDLISNSLSCVTKRSIQKKKKIERYNDLCD